METPALVGYLKINQKKQAAFSHCTDDHRRKTKRSGTEARGSERVEVNVCGEVTRDEVLRTPAWDRKLKPVLVSVT